MLLTPAKIKQKSFESRRNSFLPGVDTPHVYVCAWALGCFYSHISTRTFRRALTSSVDVKHQEPTDLPIRYHVPGVLQSLAVWGGLAQQSVRRLSWSTDGVWFQSALILFSLHRLWCVNIIAWQLCSSQLIKHDWLAPLPILMQNHLGSVTVALSITSPTPSSPRMHSKFNHNSTLKSKATTTTTKTTTTTTTTKTAITENVEEDSRRHWTRKKKNKNRKVLTNRRKRKINNKIKKRQITHKLMKIMKKKLALEQKLRRRPILNPDPPTNGNQCEQAYQTYQWWLEGVVLSLSYVHPHRGGIWSFM